MHVNQVLIYHIFGFLVPCNTGCCFCLWRWACLKVQSLFHSRSWFRFLKTVIKILTLPMPGMLQALDGLGGSCGTGFSCLNQEEKRWVCDWAWQTFSVTNLLLGIQIFPTLNFALSTDLSAKNKKCKTQGKLQNSAIYLEGRNKHRRCVAPAGLWLLLQGAGMSYHAPSRWAYRASCLSLTQG